LLAQAIERHVSDIDLACFKVCQRGEKVGSFDEELVHGGHLANADVQPGVKECGVRDAPMVDHNKRPASDDMLNTIECKRLKQEDQSKNSDLRHYSATELFFSRVHLFRVNNNNNNQAF
jgi:hypothetical protein